MTGRITPHDLEAQATVLATVLEDPTRAPELLALLPRQDAFYGPGWCRCWEGVLSVAKTGATPDLRAVKAWLRDRGALGPDELAAFAAATRAGFEADTRSAERVRDKALLRDATSYTSAAMAELYEPGADPRAWAQRLASRLASAMTTSGGSKLISAKQLMVDTMTRIEERARRQAEGTLGGFTTGLTVLDDLTSGMHPGELWILAGRPGMGKTALAVEIALEAAADTSRPERTAVAFFSIEMPLDQIGARAMSGQAGVPVAAMRHGNLSHDNWSRITKAATWIADQPIAFAGSVDSVTDLVGECHKYAAACERDAAKKRLGVVVVDYLQLVPAERRNGQNREQEVSEISRSLKRLAKTLGVCVVALAQLSRKCEERSDKRPGLADLRDSGAIEQDADLVAFVYRDEYYQPENTSVAGKAEIIVSKQRNGPTAVLEVSFDGKCTKFGNLENSQ